MKVYKDKMVMLGTDTTLKQMNAMYQQMLIKERDITKRQNALKAFLEVRKVTQKEIDFATDLNVVF